MTDAPAPAAPTLPADSSPSAPPSTPAGRWARSALTVPGSRLPFRSLVRFGTPGWRNWQTRQVEGLVALNGLSGSSPDPGTIP